MPTETDQTVSEDKDDAGGRDPRRDAFARAFTEALRDSGLSQTELAAKTGLAQATISEWKTGEAAPRTPDITFALERALKVPPGHLSQHLGYVPAEILEDNWLAGLLGDPQVDHRLRRVLLAFIREFGGHGEAGREGQ